jgi:hypothetical protein
MPERLETAAERDSRARYLDVKRTDEPSEGPESIA